MACLVRLALHFNGAENKMIVGQGAGMEKEADTKTMEELKTNPAQFIRQEIKEFVRTSPALVYE